MNQTTRRAIALGALVLATLACGLLTPTVRVSVPTPPLPTPSPAVLYTPTPDPAALVVPTADLAEQGFNACDLITEEEAAAVLGDLIYAPINGSDYLPGGGVSHTCQFDTDSNGLYLTVEIAPEAYLADATFEQGQRAAGDDARALTNLGDAAFWEPESGLMSVRVGNALLTMTFFFDDPDAFKQARALTEIALDRLRTQNE